MEKSPQIYVEHILQEIKVLASIPKSFTFQEFKSAPLTYRGAIYAIQIISEASRRLPLEWIADFPDVRWREIRAVGNVTRHEYANLQAALIWEIITIHTPALQSVMVEMRRRSL
jgi:uncharacterized protein with HEPN domain